MPRPGNRSRLIQLIARRVFPLWTLSARTRQNFPVRYGAIILKRSRCRPERIICRRFARFSNNGDDGSVFDEKKQRSNQMNSPSNAPLLPCSFTPALVMLAAEEFHDIAPPVDYSLIPPWL